jgi:hypothetical protein
MKLLNEDFIVTERPLQPPSGEGEANRNFERPNKARQGQETPWARGCTTRRRPFGRALV